MKALSRLTALLVALSLAPALPSASAGPAKPKETKIRGYVTALNSADSFEIEDYRIKSDQTIVLEFEKSI
jgi:hypothetical protein